MFVVFPLNYVGLGLQVVGFTSSWPKQIVAMKRI